MKAIIFGANGQDGHYLQQLCLSKGLEFVGVSRTGNCVHADVSSFEQVERLVLEHNPTYIFHLAANSTTQHHALFENQETIVKGSINILEAVKRHCPDARVFITGSGVQFKNAGNPISENDEFEANSPYSMARIQSVYAARYYRSLGVRAYVGYLFHHESPLRKSRHISKLIASAARKIATGGENIIELGDIDVEKEWVFAGDVVRAIFTMVEQEDIFEATIGSGVTYSIRDWLDHCFRLIDRQWKDHVILKTDFEPEYRRLVSNPSTINSLGWIPETDFKKLAEMMMLSDVRVKT